MSELTEAEREAVRPAVVYVDTDGYNSIRVRDDAEVFAAVARIKADAHAAGVAEGRALRERVEALADEWENRPEDTLSGVYSDLSEALRAALAGTPPQGEGERCRHGIALVSTLGGPSSYCEDCTDALVKNPRYYADDLHHDATEEDN